jgi:hypothetical protein
MSQQSGRHPSLIRRLCRVFALSVFWGIVLSLPIGVCVFLNTLDAPQTWSQIAVESAVSGIFLGALSGVVVGCVWCLIEIGRWTIRDWKPVNQVRAAVAVASLLCASLCAWGIAQAQYPGKRFDAVEWAKQGSRDDGGRQQMAARLVGWRLLDGKTRAEVLAILGRPNAGTTPPALMYFMGHERPFLYPLLVSMNCAWLTIEFGEDGRVSRSQVIAFSNCGCREEPAEPATNLGQNRR